MNNEVSTRLNLIHPVDEIWALWMRFSRVWMRLAEFGWNLGLAEWLERMTANAKVATVLGSIPASSDTVESESGR
jgi:hypothetical protein